MTRPKLIPGMPDFYEITVSLLSGKTLDLNAVDHQYVLENTVLSVITTDEEIHHFPLSSCNFIKYGKSYQKLMELRNQFDRREAKK